MNKFAVLAVFVFILPFTAAASDCKSATTPSSGTVPTLPQDFRGSLQLNGEEASSEATVKAYIDGNVVSSQKAVAEGTYADSEDSFVVCHGSSGDEIIFKLGNIELGTASFYPGNSSTINLSGTDERSPEAAFSAPSKAQVGEKVVLDATDSSDNGQIASYSWSISESSGEIAETSFSTTGTKTVTLTVTDLVGKTDTAERTIEVTNSGPGSGSETSSGAPGSGLGSVPQQPSTNVSNLQTIEVNKTNDTISAEVQEVNNSSKIKIDVQNPVKNSSAEDPDIESLTVKSEESIEGFTVQIKDLGKNKPSSVESSSGAYTYYSIDLTKSDGGPVDVGSGTLTFQQSKKLLQENNASPSNVKMQRYHREKWEELSTRIIGETETSYKFEARLPGFSYFAVTLENRTTSEGATCGDNVCQSGESWNTCSIDCQKPANISAKEKIEEANKTISKGTNAYELLQRAREAYQNENYTRANILAEEALNMSKKPDQSFQVFPVAAVILLLILVAIAVIKKEEVITALEGNREDEIARRLVEIKELLKQNNYGQRSKEEVAEKMVQAQNALEKDDLDQAERILSELEEELENARTDFSPDF